MFFIFALQCALFNLVYTVSQYPILIIVSYDGFRYDYLQKNLTPHMTRLRQEGSYAESIENVFPTKTFPNHFTIATGLYPEVHGVVGNGFYDPDLAKIVTIGPEMFNQNKNVVPIWRLNEAVGKGRYSGVIMWPGGVYPYQNKTPTYNIEFDEKYNFSEGIDKAMSWITHPEKPANLVMMYFHQPDKHSHIFGPNSEVVYDTVRQVDNMSLYLDQQLRNYNLKNKVTVIHLSDHGLSSVTKDRIINATEDLAPDSYTVADTSPCLHIIPKKGLEDEVYNRLKKTSQRKGHFSVYKKSELLDRWHFKHNSRIPPIFLLADNEYAFQDLDKWIFKEAEKNNITVTSKTEFGVHGYDNNVDEMRPFFMARGPRIKKNHKLKSFSTLDLYSLFAEILEISPEPNNGTLLHVRDMLVANKSNSVLNTILITVGGVLLSLLLISGAAAITVMLIKRQQNITTAAALKKRFPQTFHHSVEAQHLLDAEEA